MQAKQRGRRVALICGRVAAGVAVIGALAWLVQFLASHKDSKPPRSVQVVQVIRPPPPPPEDRPPPPPPEKVDEPLPQDEPEPTPSDAPAPSEQLGLDAEGSAGGDSFGLAARKGGHDLAGGGGAIFGWYTGRLKDQVVEQLSGDPAVRSKKFSVGVRVWIEQDGRIREARLTSSTGSRDLDSAIESALSKLVRMSEPPPVEMPQPISLRIVSRS